MSDYLLLCKGERHHNIPFDEVKRVLERHYSPEYVRDLLDKVAFRGPTKARWVLRMNKLFAEVENRIRTIRATCQKIDEEIEWSFERFMSELKKDTVAESRKPSSPKASLAAGRRRGRRP